MFALISFTVTARTAIAGIGFQLIFRSVIVILYFLWKDGMIQDKTIPDYVAIFRIHGPLLFGVTDKVNYITDHVERLPPIVIVRLRNMTAIDATGLKALEEVADRLHASGRTLLLCGAREQPAAVMKQAEFHQHVGERNICANILVALQRAEELNRAAA